MQSICVYCGSSTQVDSLFFDTAAELGKIFAENEIKLIYGGGSVGLMGTIADSTLAAGGKATGIIPRFMYEENWCHTNLSELVIVETMHERKQKMVQMADALVALPGGCGTMEELFEAITWKQLGLITKPIVIVNVDDYYTPLLKMLTSAADKNFMREKHLQMWQVVTSPDEVLPAIANAPEWDSNYRKFAAI
ncbi:TIGR00730 family Rossman fold protein [Paludibacter sp. 221]|uniref:LOG family protein n=1 Tax=Paludibacter sp. 221 TaxID=2302939 RepID=UPI0013D3FB69|nr:TIGR00730 family Rossman fold protein [Paludibacter sp. 221]NDV47311.1 TIGR00730 family Rossman fold protein [Paludibacter sp. 221]